MLQFCILFYANYTIMATSPPPIYTRDQGQHDRACLQACKGHSRLLNSANEQEIFVDELLFLSHLTQHMVKLLSRSSLRDVHNLC